MASTEPTQANEDRPAPTNAAAAWLLVCGLPAALQALAIVVLIQANTGNGSFVGLGALLLGVPYALLTLVLNAARVRQSRDDLARSVVAAMMVAFGVPVALLGGLWLVGFVVTEFGWHR